MDDGCTNVHGHAVEGAASVLYGVHKPGPHDVMSRQVTIADATVYIDCGMGCVCSAVGTAEAERPIPLREERITRTLDVPDDTVAVFLNGDVCAARGFN
jgi:hypothetical protein